MTPGSVLGDGVVAVRGLAGLGVRVVVGDAPVRALRRVDRFALELLSVLQTMQQDVAALGVATDQLAVALAGIDVRLAGLEAGVGSVDGTLADVRADVAALRADVERLQELLPDDDAGPIERVKNAIGP